MNRALANLRIGSYDLVLRDLWVPIEQDHPPEKALYRTSQAQYFLGRFRHCFVTLAKLLREYPGNEAAMREKARAEQRLMEQRTGRYDFRKMYNDCLSKILYLDHGSYFGPVKIKNSQGRGLGLFTTKNVVAGELLLCEKAFSYSYKEKYAEKTEDSSGIPILANIFTNGITVGTQVNLLKETIQKLKWNPSFLPSVTALHHGSYVPAAEIKEDVVDTYVPRRHRLSIFFCWHLLLNVLAVLAVALITLPHQTFTSIFPIRGMKHPHFQVSLFAATLRFKEKLNVISICHALI